MPTPKVDPSKLIRSFKNDPPVTIAHCYGCDSTYPKHSEQAAWINAHGICRTCAENVDPDDGLSF